MIRSKNSSASICGLGAGCKLEGRDSISNNGSRWAKLTTFSSTGRGRFPCAASFSGDMSKKGVRRGEEVETRWLRERGLRDLVDLHHKCVISRFA